MDICQKNNMKKVFILILMMVFANQLTGFAQSKPSGLLQFGFKLGLNGSNTSTGYGSGSNFKDPGMKLGALMSAFVQIPLENKLSLQPEIGYSSEGSLQEGKIGSTGNFVTVFTNKLGYLNIPVMLQYNATNKGLYAEAGPQLGVLLSAKVKNAFPGTGSASETDTKEFMKSTNFSLGFGVGYNFNNAFGIGARYMFGLSEVNEAIADMKVNTLSLSLNYSFAAGK